MGEENSHIANVSSANLIHRFIFRKRGPSYMPLCSGRALEKSRRVFRLQSPIVMGFPTEPRITRFLFATQGYDAHEIHPGSHDTILTSIEEVQLIGKIPICPHPKIPVLIACRACAD